jgi:erythromycin esterase-like protein
MNYTMRHTILCLTALPVVLWWNTANTATNPSETAQRTSPLASNDANQESAIAWIKQHAIPITSTQAETSFDDLKPLKDLIGDARIVSLGESTHGSREIFQMKHRLLEYLASELGFTIFSIEANMPESYRLNDYVLRGVGDADKLIAGMYFWTWNTLEVKDMVEWMRRFNQAGRHVEFTGFDMQTPDVAMKEVLQFLERADDEQFKTARAAYAEAARARSVAQQEFGVATGSLPVEKARGKKLKYSGWIKTEGVQGFAGLWCRADGPNGPVAFNNMEAKKIDGTRDWENHSIEFDIPDETVNINFGVIMPGTGKAWFDSLEVTFGGEPYRAPDALDLDFESEQVKGLFVFPQRTYRTQLDDKVAKTGKQSLRIESAVPPPGGVSVEQFQATLGTCQQVHAKLKQSRDELVKKYAPKDVDWAIQNARIVVTALQQRGGNMQVRDAAMADNVQWILELNPNAKIVLWAHNGHVARLPFAMGKYLDQKFGKQHVPIGFATSRGEYQAMGRQGLGNHPLQAAPADSLEAAFERTGIPRFMLDLRPAKAAADAAWLTRPRLFRSIGALAMDEQFGPAALPEQFDAVIYLDETSAARPIR